MNMAEAPLRLGMMTPSSNTVLEPVTAALLARTPWITAHFQRLRVLAINLGADSTNQFDPRPMADAAALLADAKVHALCWNGTSGAWLGLESDRKLCATITDETGLPCTTATLALMDALAALGAKRIGLVTPYLANVQDAIIENFAGLGLETVAESHLEDPGNYSFAEHSAAKVDALVREAASAKPDAIVIHCTNFRGLPGAVGIEAEMGIPVLDSVAVALWGAIRAAGRSPAMIQGAGRLFSL
jgi:maleate isomerase